MAKENSTIVSLFCKDKSGNAILCDYQIKRFFKDACEILRKIPDMESSKLKAYKKEIDSFIFINEREIPIQFNGEMGSCQRPIRVQEAFGERIYLVNSETIPAGATLEFTVECLLDDYIDVIGEWLDYGRTKGLGSWKSADKGRFTWACQG